MAKDSGKRRHSSGSVNEYPKTGPWFKIIISIIFESREISLHGFPIYHYHKKLESIHSYLDNAVVNNSNLKK